LANASTNLWGLVGAPTLRASAIICEPGLRLEFCKAAAAPQFARPAHRMRGLVASGAEASHFA